LFYLFIEMGDGFFVHNFSHGILELDMLDKDIMFGNHIGRMQWALEVERKPFLYSVEANSLSKVHQQHEIESNRSSKYGITAKEVDLNLHGITQPTKYVNIVPALFIIFTRWVIIDANFVIVVLV